MAESVNQKILEYLSNKPFDQSIKSISTHLNLSRQTTSKYLAVLVAEKKIISRQEGNTLLYSLSPDYLNYLGGL